MASYYPLVIIALAVLSGTSVEGGKRWNLFGNQPLRTFRSRDCGGSDAAFRFNSLSVSPVPIPLPGTSHLSMDVDVLRNVSDTIMADIRVFRKLNFGYLGFAWLDLTPSCEDLAASCPVDICAEIAQIVENYGCPTEVGGNGWDCTCPPVASSYTTLPNLPLPLVIGEEALPHEMFRSLISGTYKMRTTTLTRDGDELGCFEVEFGLQH